MTIKTALQFGAALRSMGVSGRAVPCGGCRLCCKTTAVISPEHGDGQFDTVKENGKEILRKVNGVCVYLTESGCSIHGNSPFVCGAFDCRMLASLPFTLQRKLIKEGLIGVDVVNRGRALKRETNKKEPSQ